MMNIKHFFKVFFKFLDKVIIFPITKFFVKIFDFFKEKLKGFERLFTNKSSLVIISLLLSLVVFFFVDTKSLTLAETTAEVLYAQKVNAIYNEEAYVIEGLPNIVDITLIGRRSDLYLAKQLPTHDVSIDLKDLKPGSHKVTLKYKGAIDNINYKLDPSIASVVIYTKVSEVRSIDVDVVNQDKLNSRLVVSDIKIDREEVIIKGSEHKLKDIASVKALVDINNLINPDVGELELTDIPLVAYDNKGNIVETETVPSKVNAKVVITSPNKVVPIKLIPKGTIAFGKAISSITSEIKEVTIYGEQTALDNITFLPIEVNIDKVNEDKRITANIEKPSGVKYVSKNSTVVNLIVGDETTKELNGIRINIDGLSEKYKATALTKEDSEITIILKGVDTVLNNVDLASIKAVVDLTGYGIGEHELPVKLTGSDIRITYTPKVKTVRIRIEKK